MTTSGPSPGAARRPGWPPAGGLVDAHQHVWDLTVRAQPWLALPGNEPLLRNYSLADLRPLATAAGVTATVVVQTVTDPAETGELLAIAARDDLVAGVVGWVDLQSSSVADQISALRARPGGQLLSGIRHPLLAEADPDWICRPAVLAGLAAVGSAGLAYDLVVPPDLLPVAAQAVAACPGLTFVLDHCGNPAIGQRPDELWLRDVRELAAFGNCVCKLSGILGEPPGGGERGGRGGAWAHLVPYWQAVLDAFGSDRIMFGTDWPVCTLSASYAQVVSCARALTAGLSPMEQDAVFTGTARRVYGLTS